MKDEEKTNAQLIEELKALRHRVGALEERGTEHIQAEEKLRRLERAVEQSIDGFAVADLDGIIQFVNPAWAKMHGYPVEELLGKHLSLFHTEEQMQEDVNPFNEQVRKQGAHQGEVGHVRKDGTTFSTRMATTILKDEMGNPTGLVGMARDISEHKQIEEALRKSEERFRGIFENVSIGLYRTTPEGRILMANPALVHMLGYSTFEELAQRDLSRDGFEPECPRSVFQQWIEREGQVLGKESVWVTHDGTALFIRESSKAIRDETGNTRYYEGTVDPHGLTPVAPESCPTHFQHSPTSLRPWSSAPFD